MKSVLKFYALGVGVLALIAAAPLPASANLIQNGSFEESSFSSVNTWLTLGVRSTTIAGWTIVPVSGQSTGSIDYIGDYWQASDGNYSIDLDGRCASGGVEQTIVTEIGETYTVCFDIAGNPDSAAIKTMELSAIGATIQSAAFTFDNTNCSLSSMGWTNVEWLFVADADSTTIRFLSTTSQAIKGYGMALDNVMVHAPIPGAALLGLLGLGSSGGLFAWRKRRAAV